MSNTLQAIYRCVQLTDFSLGAQQKSNNRINAVGESLEQFVQYLFADAFACQDEMVLMQKINNVFSYVGNANSPPDLMLKNSDAIEVKKLTSPKSGIALNSSYPKAKLFCSDAMLSEACRTSEEWQEKDLLYVIGEVPDKKIKRLWFVYGDCYAADKSVYERIKRAISDGINDVPNVEFSETNELGRVNKVDPLGITDLRIRGMWHIKHPSKVFSYLNVFDAAADFQLVCVMKEDKFNAFSEQDRDHLSSLKEHGLDIRSVQIKNPNNAAAFVSCKLISFVRSRV